MKFGGKALATPRRFLEVALCIKQRAEQYKRLVVVVSAMGRMTDALFALANQISLCPLKREQDMLISVGERISMSLLAMALAELEIDAVSLTGSQAGIVTSHNHLNARITEIYPIRLEKHLQEGKVVIVAGFQGVSDRKEITTLGRGGSDTTAVALGVALGAEIVEFYKDVQGVYFADPKTDKRPGFFTHLSFERALDFFGKQNAPLHWRAILLASKNGIPLHVLSFREEERSLSSGTRIGNDSFAKRRNPVYEGIDPKNK